MKALQVHKKNYLLLILFMSVLLAFQFPSLIRAESESTAETEKIVSEAPKESILENDAAQQTEEKKQATTEEESIAETEPLPEEETLPEIDGVSTEETESEPAEETEKAAESEQETDEDEALKQENTPNAEPAKEEEPEEAEEPEVLKQGKVLEVDALAKEPMAFGAGAEESEKTFYVEKFEDLEKAIKKAGKNPTTIIITKSFELEGTLTIGKDQDITITSGANRDEANNKITPIGEDKITMPKEDDGVEKRQELVKEAEKAGEKALKDTNLEKNPLPTVDVVIKRAKGFLETLFKIKEGGTLTLGTDKEDPLFIDGNKEVKTGLKASFIDVSGKLVMNGGIIANGNNEASDSAPIFIREGGSFEMNGGRITSNKNTSYISDSTGGWIGGYYATGGVYIDEGGSFTLNAGSIDNNEAPVGGVFLGDWYSPGEKRKATFIMNGGLIANNKGPNLRGIDNSHITEDYGGGIHVDSNSEFSFIDGIIAGNESYRGGGVAVSDNYVYEFDGNSYSKIKNVNYDDYIKYAGAYYKQNGGLIYKNVARVNTFPNYSGVGGGIYINASTAEINSGYILNNKSENMGGGIYVSIAPYVFKLDHVLVSQNKAIKGPMYHLSAGDGGGFWNCPVGNVNFEDYNSVYIFDNDA